MTIHVPLLGTSRLDLGKQFSFTATLPLYFIKDTSASHFMFGTFFPWEKHLSRSKLVLDLASITLLQLRFCS